MIAFVVVIKLKISGKMARFSEDGRLVEWVGEIGLATHFVDEHAATRAVEGICAPEIRALIRAGYAIRAVDEDTGEIHIVDAERMQPLPTPRIRPNVGPRFLGDDPRDGVSYGDHAGRADRARELVRMLFAEAPQRNWKMQTKPRISPSRIPDREYTMPISARARHAGALGRFKRTSKAPTHMAA